MKIQLLVATMNQCDYSLLDKMNVQSDAIIGNQCERNSIESFEYKGYRIKYLNFDERGVGLNRNNALMRADGDICLLADDDMRYVDNYPYIVSKAFEEIPSADLIVFNIDGNVDSRPDALVPKQIRFYNYMRYGTARIAFRMSSIRNQGIFFNLCFGGGTKHGHGEDTLFLTDCLRKGLKIYAVPVNLATLMDERESTWFKGYDEKYLRDQGALYKAISKAYWRLLCLQDAVRKYKVYRRSWYSAYKLMICGGENNA